MALQKGAKLVPVPMSVEQDVDLAQAAADAGMDKAAYIRHCIRIARPQFPADTFIKRGTYSRKKQGSEAE